MLLARAQADDGRRAAELWTWPWPQPAPWAWPPWPPRSGPSGPAGYPGRDRRRGRRARRREPFPPGGRVLDRPLRRRRGAAQGRQGPAPPGPAADPSGTGGPRRRPGGGRGPAGGVGTRGRGPATASWWCARTWVTPASCWTPPSAYKARRDEPDRAGGGGELNDPARAAKARAELAFLTDELAQAVGLEGGRDRRAASHAERAELNATRAIRAAMATSTGPTRPRPAPLLHHPDRPLPPYTPTPASRSSGRPEPRDRRESPGKVSRQSSSRDHGRRPPRRLTSPWSEPCYSGFVCGVLARVPDAWGCVPEHERADHRRSVGVGLGGALVGYVIFTLGLGIGDTDIFDWGGLLGGAHRHHHRGRAGELLPAAASQAQARPPLRPRPSRRHQLQVRLQAGTASRRVILLHAWQT